MRQYHVGDVVVVEETAGNAFPIGILTDRDIVIEVIAENVPHDSVTVEDVMSGPKRGTLPLLYESTGNNLGSVPLFLFFSFSDRQDKLLERAEKD